MKDEKAMLCPRCGRVMRHGYVRPTGKGGLCWVKALKSLLPPAVDEEFEEIGTWRRLVPGYVKAQRCRICKIVLIEYAEEE